MSADPTASSPAIEVRLDRRWLWLGLLPLAVYLLFYTVVDQVRPTGIPFPVRDLETADPAALLNLAAREAHYRYLWLSAFVVLFAGAVAIGASTALAVWRQTPRRDRSLVFAIIVAALAAIVLSEAFGTFPRWYTYMGEGLYRDVFGEREVDGAGSLLFVFHVGQELIKSATSAALFFLMAAMILTLAEPAGALSDERQARHWARALAAQRTHLRNAAILYVFAVIAMLAWMYWPLPFLADDGVSEAYRKLVIGAAVLQGVGFSLGIAAIYLPPAVVLRHRIERLAEHAVLEDGDEAVWKEENGLAVHPIDQFRQVAALVLPILVSLLPALKELGG